MELKQVVEELRVLGAFFMEQSKGSCPICILEAIRILEELEETDGTKN